MDGDEIPDKRSRVGEAVSVFKTPQLGMGASFPKFGIYFVLKYLF